MTFFPLTDEQQEWKARAAQLAEKELAPRAEETDRDSKYPQVQLNALRDAGLWGIRVSEEHGGMGADLLTTCLVVEELAKKCPTTSMCYKMHIEASEVINRIPTDYQVEKFIKPMAKGEVFTTVAGSETWKDGDNWTSTGELAPITKVDGGYQIDGVRKSYVTSSQYANPLLFFNSHWCRHIT